MNSFMLMVVPNGNGYTIETLNQRAVPHLKQSGHEVEFSYANDDGTNKQFVKVEFLLNNAKDTWHLVRAILQEHYGLAYLAHSYSLKEQF